MLLTQLVLLTNIQEVFSSNPKWILGASILNHYCIVIDYNLLQWDKEKAWFQLFMLPKLLVKHLTKFDLAGLKHLSLVSTAKAPRLRVNLVAVCNTPRSQVLVPVCS